ncbi:Carbon-nitrogen hydrolase [Acididesulfobacillus acetoxydans]|uniref:Carbon-nitrogen hydrolase n=1 Tax=Acididesulfobacillus acetoxydans TaxID=1561005 RepID=A0A8S0VY63_9FIRM|nr:hypothetical protein [Acididesulfobacillus acetoxydans]CAA7602663.1 Carbon-nitrogen hydrolase [Acididesulfobacillus acetoxydans]CEJ09136.1 Carbon-nitrogen hydrolase [Acididesulfobacillus acetoxydans]
MNLKEGIQLAVFWADDLAVIRGRNYEMFISEAAEFAIRNNVFLVPGLYIKEEHLCLCVMDNKGNLIGEQKATHLNSAWFGDLQRSSEIRLIDTPFAKLFLCVDIDIYKPEVLRIAALLGAEIVVSSQYIAEEDFNEAMILAGAWQQAQQNCLYVIHSTNITGNIIGPCAAVQDLSGFITRTETRTPLYAELSAKNRQQAYTAFPVFKGLNLQLYQNHLKELWD